MEYVLILLAILNLIWPSHSLLNAHANNNFRWTFRCTYIHYAVHVLSTSDEHSVVPIYIMQYTYYRLPMNIPLYLYTLCSTRIIDFRWTFRCTYIHYAVHVLTSDEHSVVPIYIMQYTYYRLPMNIPLYLYTLCSTRIIDFRWTFRCTYIHYAVHVLSTSDEHSVVPIYIMQCKYYSINLFV